MAAGGEIVATLQGGRPRNGLVPGFVNNRSDFVKAGWRDIRATRIETNDTFIWT
jgi:hypothetical protein